MRKVTVGSSPCRRTVGVMYHSLALLHSLLTSFHLSISPSLLKPNPVSILIVTPLCCLTSGHTHFHPSFLKPHHHHHAAQRLTSSLSSSSSSSSKCHGITSSSSTIHQQHHRPSCQAPYPHDLTPVWTQKPIIHDIK